MGAVLVAEYIVLVALVLSLAYVFAKAMQRSLADAIVAVMILANIYAILLMLLGVDRPLAIICTRLGCTTITCIQAFLLLETPLTIIAIIKKKQLKQALG